MIRHETQLLTDNTGSNQVHNASVFFCQIDFLLQNQENRRSANIDSVNRAFQSVHPVKVTKLLVNLLNNVSHYSKSTKQSVNALCVNVRISFIFILYT